MASRGLCIQILYEAAVSPAELSRAETLKEVEMHFRVDPKQNPSNFRSRTGLYRAGWTRQVMRNGTSKQQTRVEFVPAYSYATVQLS